MEIRNNTPINSPAFGMAFKKPNEEGLAQLTEYLSKNNDIRDVSAGLRQLILDQADNKHFDIEYIPYKNSFSVIPKSKEAQKLVQGKQKIFEPSKKKGTEIERIKTDLKTPVSVYRRNGMSKFEIYKLKLTGFLKVFWEELKEIADPKRCLPENLKAATDYADRMADKIERKAYNRNMINDLFNETQNK